MNGKFSLLLAQHGDSITRAWADEIYDDRRTELPSLLSYNQLVEHLPELLKELAQVLDNEFSPEETAKSIRHLRFHAQVRFQQDCLIDEVARELMILRDVLNDFLWREGISAMDEDIWELRDALQRTNGFVDELIAQAVVVYAACLRPSVRTRTSAWWPPRRRRTDFPERDR